MHPGDVVMRPIDGGFLIEWLEQSEPDQRPAPGMPPNFGAPMRMIQKKQACRTTMDEAFAFVQAILNRKEMLRKAGKLDTEPDGMMLGGTGCFPGPSPG